MHVTKMAMAHCQFSVGNSNLDFVGLLNEESADVKLCNKLDDVSQFVAVDVEIEKYNLSVLS